VRQQIDADANRADLGRGFVDAAGNAGGVQPSVRPPMPPPTMMMSSMFPSRLAASGDCNLSG
jgi:hypothetical protein